MGNLEGDPEYYNLAAIRQLLLAAFLPEELRRFCFDRVAFRPIVRKFGPKYNLEDMVDEVLLYCRSRALLAQLLTEVQQVNPHQYTRFEQQVYNLADPDSAVSLYEPPVLPPANLDRYAQQATIRDTELVRAARNRAAMLTLVHNTWIKGVLEQSLHGATAVLQMDRRADAVEQPWDAVVQMPGDSRETLPRDSKIIEVFDDVGQSLLILGEPGSGKTTTLLELARDTIIRAERDYTEPIPVVFNLSSWGEKRLPIAAWLTKELNTKYNIPTKVARAWIEHDDLLLLMDGLDEVEVVWQAACVQALNAFRSQHLMPMVVCSRSADYHALSTKLNLTSAVLLQPLSPEQVDDYLERAGDEFSAVRQLLRQDTALQELAKLPLMLSIMTLAYRRLSTQDLQAADTPAAHRQRLAHAYVQSMFDRRGLARPYTKGQTIHWLVWLGREMVQRNQSEFLIEQMQPDLLSSQRQTRRYRAVLVALVGIPVGLLLGVGGAVPVAVSGVPDIARAFGLGLSLAAGVTTCLFLGTRYGLIRAVLIGLLFGLAFGWPFSATFGPTTGWSIGLSVGLATSTAFGLFRWLMRGVVPDWETIEPIEALDWSWQKAIPSLLVGACAGGVFGLVLALSIFEPLMPLFGACFGLAAGLAGAILGGLTSHKVQTRTRPNQGILQSARVASRVGILILIAVGLPVGLSTGWAWGQNFRDTSEGLIIGITTGLTIGMAVGMVVSLVFGGLACVQHFLLRFLLFRDARIPWRYARFLDYATERIFLRKVGGGYIFVHRLLQEYFASLADESAQFETE